VPRRGAIRVAAIRRLAAKLGALARWTLVEPHAVWTGLLVPLVALTLASLAPGAGELRVRAVACLMTLAGVVLVARGIIETRRRFGRPPLRARARAWLRRRPRLFDKPPGQVIRPDPVVARFGVGSPTVAVGAPRSASIDERVAWLEQKVQSIDGRLRRIAAELRADADQLRTLLGEERAARAQADEKVEKLVEEIGAGGLDFEGVGVWWVIVGALLEAFPAEVARLLAWS
jgi:hypothetical protein